MLYAVSREEIIEALRWLPGARVWATDREGALRQCRDVLTMSMRNSAGFTTFQAAA